MQCIIGNFPLIKLKRLPKSNCDDIKYEVANPTGSMKDRITLYLMKRFILDKKQ